MTWCTSVLVSSCVLLVFFRVFWSLFVWLFYGPHLYFGFWTSATALSKICLLFWTDFRFWPLPAPTHRNDVFVRQLWVCCRNVWKTLTIPLYEASNQTWLTNGLSIYKWGLCRLIWALNSLVGDVLSLVRSEEKSVGILLHSIPSVPACWEANVSYQTADIKKHAAGADESGFRLSARSLLKKWSLKWMSTLCLVKV